VQNAAEDPLDYGFRLLVSTVGVGLGGIRAIGGSFLLLWLGVLSRVQQGVQNTVHDAGQQLLDCGARFFFLLVGFRLGCV